ncbi:swr1 complex component [Orbilia ellipsospora]|uniref:DNA helicase n=1 Tax=Orbilia ellipsospora TaxID=2528407 RepID=A0AAV9XBT3_9PEZI
MTPDGPKSDPEASQNDRNGHLPATRSSSRTSRSLQVDTQVARNLDSDPSLNNEIQQLLNPSKKRKLNGPPSPPWKSAAAQTPSSFIDDSGRKRSMRMMGPPPTPVTPAKEGRQRRNGTRTSPRSKQQQTPLSASKSSASKSSQRNNTRSAPASASRSPIKQTRQASQARTSTKPSPKNPSPPKRTQSGSFATSTAPRRRSGRLATAEEPAEEEEEDEDVEMQDEPEGFDEEDYDSSKRISWRLKFSRKVKPPLVCNVGNLALPARFNSLREYFDAEDNDPEYLKQMQDAAESEAAKRIKLEEAYETGLLRPENLQPVSIQLVPAPERLRPQWGHHDHLVNHAIRFSKLLKRERMQHIKDAKALAKDAADAARKRRPKTREEIEAEQRETSIKRYRDVIASFKVKLKLTEKAAQDVRREKYLEAYRLANRESLKQMLHHSSQLLNTRIQARQAVSEADDESLINEELNEFDEDLDEEADDGESVSFGDASNMSDSDSSEDGEAEEDADDKLSPEELRRKYARLAEIESVDASGAEETDASMSMDEVTFADADAPEDSKSRWHDDESVQLTAEEMDGSDEDVPMDSEEDASDEEIEDSELGEEEYDGEDDDEEDDDEAEDGLFGFFSKDEIEQMRQGVQTDEYSNSGRNVVEESEDEEDLDEVDMVPVSTEEKVEHDQNDDQYEEAEPSVNGTHHEEHDDSPCKITHPHATSDDSSVAKTGVSEVSSVTTPASIGLAGDHKDAPKIPISSLLRGTLREYQHHGLEWLANLYDNGTNGILADEMGLGKTIQTIALISHLATSHGVWGPHLVVVPTSVILNWEMEFKKWAPGFKIMTYYGSREERQEKRKGWMDYDAWDVCITSYQLVVQDSQPFKRRSWHYLILDEAHNIKNFRSQRWQTLLNFKAYSRLLLTGTPLQNNLIELWSLLYFLMPSGSGMSNVMPQGFTNLKEFQDWFARPVDQLIEGGREGMDEESRDSIKKLHTILRPYLLRRLKKDVEKQMPEKHEHIVWCRLSKRQRFLYDDFMSRAQTRETLTTGNYLSIINCLMQLRKVCNHPDLFETRPIVTSYAMRRSAIADFEINELFVRRRLFKEGVFDTVNFDTLNLNLAKSESKTRLLTNSTRKLVALKTMNEHISDLEQEIVPNLQPDFTSSKTLNEYISNLDMTYHLERVKQQTYLNNFRCGEKPIYGSDLRQTCNIGSHPLFLGSLPKDRKKQMDWLWNRVHALEGLTPTVARRAEEFDTIIQKFGCVTPAVVAADLPSITVTPAGQEVVRLVKARKLEDPFHRSRNRLSIAFPDKRLLQYDCGKLQKLDTLLRHLQEGGHRALIFTQMTKVLDILEQFLNIHGHRYLRLDGATKVEQRQILTERFNNDNRILVFILSTRSGGLGLNLTGADSVIFYDLDWNPAMDKQCQDRCHRIGQTRDVHIYRFVSEFTIESNILRKSNQKQMLDDVVIQEGEFTVDKFNRLTVADLFGEDAKKFGLESIGGMTIGSAHGHNMNSALEQVEDADDVVAAKVASKEAVENLDRDDFGGLEAGGGEKPSGTPRDSEHPSTPTPTAGATPAAHDEGEEQQQQQQQEEEEEEDSFRTVDDYLIRFWEWDLRDTAVIIPDKNKKKSKKAKPP